MRDLRVEITDQATALYIAVDPDGLWAKTTHPDHFVTIDWDGQGRVIGVEAIGSAARNSINALIEALVSHPAKDPEAIHAALQTLQTESDEDVAVADEPEEIATA